MKKDWQVVQVQVQNKTKDTRLRILYHWVAGNVRDNRVVMSQERDIKFSFCFLKYFDQWFKTERFPKSSDTLPTIVSENESESVICCSNAILHLSWRILLYCASIRENWDATCVDQVHHHFFARFIDSSQDSVRCSIEFFKDRQPRESKAFSVHNGCTKVPGGHKSSVSEKKKNFFNCLLCEYLKWWIFEFVYMIKIYKFKY